MGEIGPDQVWGGEVDGPAVGGIDMSDVCA